MNLDMSTARQLAGSIRSSLEDPGPVEVVLCAPFVYLDAVYGLVHGSPISVGAQNMHAEDAGAYTGEISASMLRSVGCSHVILGHSERRQYFGETDKSVRDKVVQAVRHGLVPVVCVGELLDERDKGEAEAVVARQVRGALEGVAYPGRGKLVIAYEPVWAIGTGRTASPEQAQAMHAHIRTELSGLFSEGDAARIDILYGGSMKPANADDLLSQPDINGGLIGGASLEAAPFLSIVRAAMRADRP